MLPVQACVSEQLIVNTTTRSVPVAPIVKFKTTGRQKE